MNTIKFKKSLFGFKRRQVIDYIAQTEAEYFNENSRLNNELSLQTKQVEQLGDEILSVTDALARASEINEQSQKQIAELSERSESFKSLSVEMMQKSDLLEQQLMEKSAAFNLLSNENIKLKEELVIHADSEVKLKQELEKTLEKTALNEHMHSKSRTLLIEYLDLIHRKNIELTNEKYLPEPSISNINTTPAEPVFSGKTAEELLQTIRNDIGNALNTITHSSEEKLKNKSEPENLPNLKVL